MSDAGTWRRAGLRAGTDPSKVRVALVGWMLVVPALVGGGLLARLVVPVATRPGSPLASLAFGPLREAWREDRDLALLVVLLVQLSLLGLLVAFFAGALHRLAGVELATGVREGTGAGLRFAARRTGRFLGALGGTVLVVLGPLLLAALFVATGPSGPGWMPVAAVLLALLGFGGLLAGSTLGFASAAAVATEDLGARAAVLRAARLVRAFPLRVIRLRIGFLTSALLSTLFRTLPALLVLAVALGTLRLLGPAQLDRALAVLRAGGIPADADRLGLTAVDVGLAVLLAVGAAGFGLGLLAHLGSRLAGVRTALFLFLRQEAEQVPPTRLEPPAQDPRHRGPEAAGFRLQGRLEG